MFPEKWQESCEKLIKFIPQQYPWWFDNEPPDEYDTHDHYLCNITLQPQNKFLGEDCVICNQNIGQNPVIVANYKSLSTAEPLCFFVHPQCCYDL